MARIIEIVSTSTGIHHLEFGLDSSSLTTFSIQMWITKYGKRYIDWAQSLGMGMVTFMGGDLWIHNDINSRRCNLYGEQKDFIVGVVTNEEPTRVKIFDSLGVFSDGQWEVTEVIIPKDLNHPNGMYSKIPKERFKKRDGIWRAEFLRNMKTTSSTASVIEALSGEPLRGNECYFILKNVNNPSGEQVKLFKVQVEATLSRGS